MNVNNIIVYCETNGNSVAEVSFELLTKARSLANQLKVQVEGILIGNDLKGLEKQLFAHGAQVVHKAEDKRLEFYQTMSHTAIVCKIMETEQPQIGLFGASPVGRDLAPRVASKLKSGLTADCTSLEIGEHYEKKTDTKYENLLYQIRPAFGGNIVATIINPDTRPQLATVREGVMKREEMETPVKGKIKSWNVEEIVGKDDFAYLYQLADVLGGEVGGTRAAVDAGYIDHDRQIGQTGVTVRPKLYIACGISGQIQHRAGMMESSMIISINTDPNAPINSIADYVITGDFAEVVPKLIKYYKKNSK